MISNKAFFIVMVLSNNLINENALSTNPSLYCEGRIDTQLTDIDLCAIEMYVRITEKWYRHLLCHICTMACSIGVFLLDNWRPFVTNSCPISKNQFCLTS